MRTRTILLISLLLIGSVVCPPAAMATNKPPLPPPAKLPDLVITGIKYFGTKANIEVWNKGEANSTPCQMKFTLADGELWTFKVPGLMARGFVHTAYLSRGKPFAGPGKAVVDFEQQVTESNENNNEFSINESATVPDLAAVSIYFKSEGRVEKVIGVIQNVGKFYFNNVDGLQGKARLVRIAKYGVHQHQMTVKTFVLPTMPAGLKYELKADMPPPFKGADSYVWVLKLEVKDADQNNNVVEKTMKKFDNNN